jgi:hypothetical protein
MRSRPYTDPHPTPSLPAPHPGRSGRRARARRKSPTLAQRRARLNDEAALFEPGSAAALYRAEKARRAMDAGTAMVMADAKRLYDAAVAETAAKRAGMRSAVVPPAARRTAASVPDD